MSRTSVVVPSLLVSWLGCGGATPPAGEPSKPPAPATATAFEPASPPLDAAPAPPIDAGPPSALLTAPAWIFRYDAPPRLETWTLRTRDGQAMIDVDTPQGTTRYLGTATEDASLALDVASRTATMKLDCRPATRPIGATCDARQAAPLDVLDCYHPDFAAPMTFARAPGVEFTASCNGYRRLR